MGRVVEFKPQQMVQHAPQILVKEQTPNGTYATPLEQYVVVGNSWELKDLTAIECSFEFLCDAIENLMHTALRSIQTESDQQKIRKLVASMQLEG